MLDVVHAYLINYYALTCLFPDTSQGLQFLNHIQHRQLTHLLVKFIKHNKNYYLKT